MKNNLNFFLQIQHNIKILWYNGIVLKVQLNNYIVYHAKMPVDLFVNYRSIGIFYAKQKVIKNIFMVN